MNIEYRLKDDGTAAVTKIAKPEALVEIPAEIDGHTVTELDSDFIPFGVKTTVREIILPETIRKIGTRAFNDMRYLKKLNLPESLTEIDDFGIFTCPDLVELFIPESVTAFGQRAFGYMYEHGRAYKLNYFTLLCIKGSPAHKFAEENQIKFQLA